jgi:hypothetical protein
MGVFDVKFLYSSPQQQQNPIVCRWIQGLPIEHKTKSPENQSQCQRMLESNIVYRLLSIFLFLKINQFLTIYAGLKDVLWVILV